ncbi:hypothetical protein B0H14DRAFT_2894664 [Mycena olivaceomarginata]|nr:hypothetical protein B0H14DRAFT_2894664 [Mycena olivaceomarginata]
MPPSPPAYSEMCQLAYPLQVQRPLGMHFAPADRPYEGKHIASDAGKKDTYPPALAHPRSSSLGCYAVNGCRKCSIPCARQYQGSAYVEVTVLKRGGRPYRQAGNRWERKGGGEAVDEAAGEEAHLREVQARADLAYVYVYAARYIENERGQMIYLTGLVVRQGVLSLARERWEGLDLLEIVVELAAILVCRVKLHCRRHRGPPRLLLFYRLRLRVPRSERHLTGGRAMRRQGQGRQMRRQVKNVIRARSKTPSLS